VEEEYFDIMEEYILASLMENGMLFSDNPNKSG
jgi:hypothetical protein